MDRHIFSKNCKPNQSSFALFRSNCCKSKLSNTLVFSPNEHLFSCFSDFLSFSQFVENAFIYRGTPLHKPDEHVCKKYNKLKIHDDDDVDDDDDEIFVIINYLRESRHIIP